MRRTQKGNTIYLADEWDPVTDIDIRNTPVKKGALIFLSACQTGQQKYAGGGHFQGLAQAFLKKGASHVISSLVPVYDETSRYFTLSFFNRLLSGESVTTSLQESQIETREKYKAHIFWLPYTHYGSVVFEKTR